MIPDRFTPRMLVFDRDGVILDSARLKRAAFAALYDDQSAPVRQAVAAYLGRRGGQPREVKFRHIEGQILGRPPSQARIAELCQRFRQRMQRLMAEAPMITGAQEALERWKGACPLVLLSATPQQELVDCITERGLSRYFDDVIGAPPDKVTALSNLLARLGRSDDTEELARRTVMIGDSYNDYRAARSNGTAFVGVGSPGEASPFPTDTTTIEDLHGLDQALAGLTLQRKEQA